LLYGWEGVLKGLGFSGVTPQSARQAYTEVERVFYLIADRFRACLGPFFSAGVVVVGWGWAFIPSEGAREPQIGCRVAPGLTIRKSRERKKMRSIDYRPQRPQI